MKTISKFVLNRNDQVFCYVEKVGKNSRDIHYKLYRNSNDKIVYNQHNFHAIHGNDIKMSLQKFAYDATDVLIHGINSDINQERSYTYFTNISDKLKTLDRKNPKIDSKPFIEAIDVFNKVLPNSIENEIDYHSDYLLVNNEDEEHVITEHIKNVQHKNYSKNYTNEENYEIAIEKINQRVKKYDN